MKIYIFSEVWLAMKLNGFFLFQKAYVVPFYNYHILLHVVQKAFKYAVESDEFRQYGLWQECIKQLEHLSAEKEPSFNGKRSHDLGCVTGAMLYQLSYEAIHVGSWCIQFVGFICPRKIM